MAAREGDRLLWVLGVDMAHMGRRYGDNLTATAGRGQMEESIARVTTSGLREWRTGIRVDSGS